MHRQPTIAAVAAIALLYPTLATTPTTALPHAGNVAAASPTGDTACGVERWSVKTGTDSDAHLVNQRAVTPTNIIHLRSLPPLAQLPVNSRVRPVETTVWGLDAILVRYKEETDSDYHLVLSDTGGRTLIAEIPAPECVGSSSPFLPAIRSVRAAFTPRFQPTTSFQRVSVKVHVTGVGFFDFEHGQSGVAPNAIELHPVLSISWAGAAPAAPPAPTSPTPVVQGTPLPAPVAGTPTAAPRTTGTGSLIVRAQVSPNPTRDGTTTTVSAVTTPGAVCGVRVVYASGRPSSAAGLATSQTADSAGRVAWTWRPATSVPGPATATVHCARGSAVGTATAPFTVG